MAKGTDRADSDIDLLVLSNSLHHDQLYEALGPAEKELGRPVNPTLLSLEAWRARRAEPDTFASRIVDSPHLFVLGSDEDLL